MPATANTVREPWTIAGNLDAQVRETHTGLVVLLGDKAYKAKKPVTTDFLDFSTPARRQHACDREVALNSRLSPNSYPVRPASDRRGGWPGWVGSLRLAAG